MDEVYYNEEMDIIEVKLPAEADLYDVIRIRDKIAVLISEYGCNRVLGDAREHKNILDLYEVWNVGSSIWDTFPHDTKIALVHDNLNEEQVLYFIRIVKNRGFKAQCFLSYEKALLWLEL